MRHATSPKVRLGDVLVRSDEAIQLRPDETYTEVTVRLWGRGVVPRRTVLGANAGAQTRRVVRAGQLVLSRIDARHGAVGLVPLELDGAVVSNDFPSFVSRPDRLDVRFLGWLTRSQPFVDACVAASEGTTNRVRLKDDKFLAFELLLPPLAEQQRVVSRIEDLSCRISEAAVARLQVANGTAALRSGALGVIYDRLARQWPIVPFGDFEPHVTSGPRNWARNYARGGFRFYRAQDVGPDGSTLENSKVFVVPPTDGTQGRNAQVGPGDLLIVITGATVGRCALVTSVHEPGFVSQHVALCRLPANSIDSTFALAMLMCPQGQAQLLGQRYGQGKPGLSLGSVKALRVPVPPLSEQRRTIRELNTFRSKVTGLESLQTQVASELDALLPSILDKAFRGEL